MMIMLLILKILELLTLYFHIKWRERWVGIENKEVHRIINKSIIKVLNKRKSKYLKNNLLTRLNWGIVSKLWTLWEMDWLVSFLNGNQIETHKDSLYGVENIQRRLTVNQAYHMLNTKSKECANSEKIWVQS